MLYIDATYRILYMLGIYRLEFERRDFVIIRVIVHERHTLSEKAKSSAFSAAEVRFATIPLRKTIQLLLHYHYFIHRTSTYTITFTHHREGSLGLGLGLI